MALFLPNEAFAYIGADEKIHHVDGTDVIDRSVWSGSIAYVPNDVVQYGDMLFVALAANFNMAPTAIVDDNWSSLVRTAGIDIELTVEEVYALVIQTGSVAYDALRTAWTGTAAASWAYPALTTAWVGTATAYEALQQAWYGTQAAAQIGYPALTTAWAGTAAAYEALVTAWVGTATAYTALQQAWYGTEAAAAVGYPALVTAWVGTATANSALAAASSGTVAAAAGIDLANQAFQLATSGTAQAEDAHDLAQLAYDLASVNPSQPDVGNWLMSGGNVIWTSGYSFDVPPTVVAFNGTAVSFAGTSVTLQDSDPTNDRIDLVVADNSYGTIAVVTGIPTTPPAPPDYDPDSQFQLTFVPVDANTTQPEDVDIAWIYLENTEWTLTATHASIDVNSVVNPYAGTKDIEGTSCPNGAVVRYQAPFVFELNNYQTLYFYLAPKAGWGTRSLRVQFETSSGVIGKILTIKDTTFGFITANPAYQLIAIPINLFAVPVGTQVFRIRFSVVSSGAALSGFYLDTIGLQLGVAPPAQAIADASTTVKGIVQLEQNGGTISGRAVTGDDYRLALAVAGTSLAYNALQQAWYGTQAAGDIGYPALVTAWVGTATANVALSVAATGTAGVATEISNRSAADTSLQNQINDINADLGISFQGTFALYMANFRNGPPDNKVTVINGVVTSQTPSYYIWEDFENYPYGTLPPLTLGSAWSGAGTIVSNPGIGIQAEDQIQYGTGTYLEPFTGTVYQIMSGGTGWGSPAVLSIPYIGLKGTETFTSYGTGTYPADTGPLIYGMGWAGAGTVIAR